MSRIKRIKERLKQEVVLLVAVAAAIVSLVLVPPSAATFQMIDTRVLSLLFCLMAVVAGLQSVGVFATLGQRLIAGIHNTRLLCATLVLLCFFSSMLITNDVALITFVPFAVLVLTLTGQSERLIYVIVLQTVAANLGSMLTPVGNPQNLYLYSDYSMTPAAFFALTVPVTGAALVILVALCLLIKPEQVDVDFHQQLHITDKRRLIVYLVLFALCLVCVFQGIPTLVLLAIVVGTLLIVDRTLLRRVDYGLLLTFVCFFVFVGNLEQMESVRELIASLVAGREALAAAILSQIISNVPAAVLLSGFTNRADALVLGTNIGGLGTLVASLASLISFKLYAKTENARVGRYFGMFTVVNFGMLAVLLLVFVR